MITIAIQVDPVILQSIERLAKERGSTKSQVIRDAMYSAVWDWQAGKLGGLQAAPKCPKNFDGLSTRVLHGELVQIDGNGLVVQ